MLFLAQIVPTLLAAFSLVKAASIVAREQDDFFCGWLEELRMNNLTILADNYDKISKTDKGKSIVDVLKNGGDLTVLAPINSAFDPKNPCIEPDEIKYNTLWGNINNNFRSTGSSLTRRAAESRSNVPNTFPRQGATSATKRQSNLDNFQVTTVDQSYDLSRKKRNNGRTILIGRPVGNSRVVGEFSYKQIIVLPIDEMTDLPGPSSNLLSQPLIKTAPNGFSKFSNGLKKTGLDDVWNTRSRLTGFVPVDEDFNIDKLSKDGLYCLLESHMIFDKIIYSTLFTTTPEARAKSGKLLHFSYENDVSYVSCGDSKHKSIVLRGDVITSNGVFHIINKPLKCE
ncbi:sepiapterin reductase, partial [Rhizoctonia solani]